MTVYQIVRSPVIMTIYQNVRSPVIMTVYQIVRSPVIMTVYQNVRSPVIMTVYQTVWPPHITTIFQNLILSVIMTVHKNVKLLVIVTVLSKCQIINQIDCLPKWHTTSVTIPLREDLTSSIRHLDGSRWTTLWVDPLEVSSEPSFFWECRFSKYLFDYFSITKRKFSKYMYWPFKRAFIVVHQ
jgi:hypothetical protein